MLEIAIFLVNRANKHLYKKSITLALLKVNNWFSYPYIVLKVRSWKARVFMWFCRKNVAKFSN